MQNLKRNINMGFRVTEAEQAMIRRSQAQTGIRNLRAYLLKMAMDGMVINLDLTDVRECSRLLRNVSNNVNQIAKRVNETGNIYAVDIEGVQNRLGEIWKQQDKIIADLAKFLEVAWCRNRKLLLCGTSSSKRSGGCGTRISRSAK